jgi:hypothetical protein
MSLREVGREEGAAFSVFGEVPLGNLGGHRNFTGNLRLTRKQGCWATAAVGFLGTPDERTIS